jgi:hypothetical protein
MQDIVVQKAPNATLKAYGHGREINFGTPGVVMVLCCVARETADQAQPVVRAIREVHPDAGQVLVCNIADVRSIPKLLKPVVQQLMKSSYTNAVENLPPGRTAEDHVLILPDWDNELLGPLGIDDVSKSIAVVVLAPDGRVAVRHQGSDAATAVLEAIAGLIEKTPA